MLDRKTGQLWKEKLGVGVETLSKQKEQYVQRVCGGGKIK